MQEFINFNSAKISWFRCGGNIDVFCIVNNVDELFEAVKKYSNLNDKILICGAGSNLLIRDKGYRGLCIKLSNEFLKIEKINKNEIDYNNCSNSKDDDYVLIRVGSGAFVKSLSQFAIHNELLNAEFFDTIPGTIGGAVKMNAGCFGCETKDILYSVDILNKDKIETHKCKDINFSYRNSNLSDNSIILSTIFKLKKPTNHYEIEKAKQKIADMRQHRNEKQPNGFTCGSTFTNPVKNGIKYNAWELIDKVGMRGYSIGGAKFSEKHCNFIINTGNATANDIEELIKTAILKVKEKFDIDLKLEIKIFGEK